MLSGWKKPNPKMAAIFVFTFASLATLSYIRAKKYSSIPVPGADPCKATAAAATITPVKDNRTFMIAAYFDNRPKGKRMTRVIGIAHHKDVKNLHCWFCCPSDGDIHVSKANVDIHPDRFDFPYSAADLTCTEPKNCVPSYVTICGSFQSLMDQPPWLKIHNREVQGPFVEFTLCVAPMFGKHNNILQFLQSMEMYKILGVGKVVIYKHSCSQQMQKVLDFYVAEHIVEIVPWPVDSHLRVSPYWYRSAEAEDLSYYGQTVALNDCIYRNMFKTKYVILNDADEIILPVKHRNWRTMMQELQNQNPVGGIFLFENHIFPKTVVTPTVPLNITSWSAIPGVNILQHVLREPDRKEVFNPRKMIVDPRKVVQTSVHSVLKAYGDSVKVPMDVALVYHCRLPLQSKLPRESLIEDTTLWRYNVSLLWNVNKVLRCIAL